MSALALVFIIYGLFDPTTGELRYVGKSCSGLNRPRHHGQPHALAANINPHLCNWIKKLHRAGLRYEIGVLEIFSCKEELPEAEEWNIAYYLSLGCRLTNVRHGDQRRTPRAPARQRTPEEIAAMRERMAAAQRGKKHSEEAKLRMRTTPRKKRVPVTEETRRKLSEARLRRGSWSLEVRHKIGEGVRAAHLQRTQTTVEPAVNL